MNWSLNTWPLVTWIWLAEAASFLALLLWSWGKKAPGATAFRGLAFGSVLYVAAEAISLVVGHPTVRHWLSGISFCGVGLIIPSLLFLFCDVTGLNRWLSPKLRFLLFLSCTALAASRFVDPWFHHMFRSLTIVREGGYYLWRYEPGMALLVLTGLMALSMLLSLATVYFSWRESSPLMRRHLGALAIACLFPVVTATLFAMGVRPLGWVETTPFALLATITLTSWAIFHHRVVEVAPIARSYLVEHFCDAMLAADAKLSLVDINPTARRMLGFGNSRILGQPMPVLLANWPVLSELCSSDEAKRVELQPTIRGEVFWEASWQPFKVGGRSQTRAFLLVISDISARKRIELQLHDLLAERTGKWRHATSDALRMVEQEQDQMGRALHETLCHDLARFAHTVETQLPPQQECVTASGGVKTQPVALAAELYDASRRARALSRFWENPDLEYHSFSEAVTTSVGDLETILAVSCELTIAPDFPALSNDRSRHLIRVIREAVVNAARKGYARKITIVLSHKGENAIVTIAHDGIPLSPSEQLANGSELRQMRLRAELLNGSLTLYTGKTGGTTIELSLPSREPDIAPGFFRI